MSLVTILDTQLWRPLAVAGRSYGGL